MKIKKILRWAGVSLGFIFVVLLLAWAVMNAYWGAELRKAFAELKARGEPTTIAGIVPPAVPDDQNAARDINMAISLMSLDNPGAPYVPGKPAGKVKPSIEALNDYYQKWSNGRASAEETKKSIELVMSPELTEIFASLDAAAKKPGYNQDLKYEEGFAAPLPNLGRFRLAVKLLSLKALSLADKGDIAGACDTIEKTLTIANLLRDEPVLVSCLVRIACIPIAAETINDVDDNCTIPAESARRLIAELEKSDATVHLKKSMVFERVASGQSIYEKLISGKQGIKDIFFMEGEKNHHLAWRMVVHAARPFLKREYCEYLRIMKIYEGLCDKPFYQSRDEISQLNDYLEVDCRKRFYPLARILFSNYTKIFERNAELQTRLAITTVNLALVIYKGKNAAFPERLDQLKPDILKEIPIDQLTGTSLTYKKDGDKYILFSEAVNKLEEERRLGQEMPKANK